MKFTISRCGVQYLLVLLLVGDWSFYQATKRAFDPLMLVLHSLKLLAIIP
jgi:hypothetical protein